MHTTVTINRGNQPLLQWLVSTDSYWSIHREPSCERGADREEEAALRLQSTAVGDTKIQRQDVFTLLTQKLAHTFNFRPNVCSAIFDFTQVPIWQNASAFLGQTDQQPAPRSLLINKNARSCISPNTYNPIFPASYSQTVTPDTSHFLR